MPNVYADLYGPDPPGPLIQQSKKDEQVNELVG